MKCYVGSIITINENDDVFGYLVEDHGKILYVGNQLPKEYEQAERIELGDKALIPSFVDTHQHLASFSTFQAGLNVMDAETNIELASMIQKFVNHSKEKTLICFGASPYSVKEGKLISRKELDLVCPDKEIMVVKYDGHACIINSKLMNRLKKKLEKLRGYHPETGEMNQEAFFACSDYITNSISILYYTDEQVIDFCKRANRAGLQIEMHAIGDKAFDQACRAIKAALDDYPRENHRHGIIHDCLPTEEGVKICRDYHIQMPVQSAFINWKQEPDEYLEAILGKERAEKLNPLGTFVRNGIIISDGSDAPCTTPNPIAWIDKAVNHPVHGEAISVQDALRMCTYNGYYASFDEDKRGSLEVGKFADMVILSENPYEVEKTDLKNIKVEQLLLQGLPYRSCRENIFKAALRGLHSRDA